MTQLYKEIYKLKNLLRKGWLVRNACDKTTKRVESDAEHTFSMAILALEIMHKENLKLDEAKVLKMILYHELCEIDTGDYTPLDDISTKEKYLEELKAVTRISQECSMPEILSVWKEFEENKTQEAQFVKIIDKLDAIMQSQIYSEQSNNQELFNEFYNYSKEKIDKFKKYLK